MVKKTFFSTLLGIIIWSSFAGYVCAKDEKDDCKRLGQPCTCSTDSDSKKEKKYLCVRALASDLSFSDFKCPCE